MTHEQILKLVDAGYTKAEIEAMEPKPDPKPAEPTPDPKPAEPTPTPVAFDYSKMASEFAKVLAGTDIGGDLKVKTKDEKLEDALHAFIRG